ncbi:MAG: hypothetical protein KKC51_07110, partial [Verrucomicrobia bacterium]|nr:hypothetical protein [Verrucomicrobiota bacterium]
MWSRASPGNTGGSCSGSSGRIEACSGFETFPQSTAVKTVCAASVLWGREAFGGLGEILVLPDDRITPDDVRGADALIVRSKTRVDEALLGGSSVSFVGTATAGFDHLDTAWLDAAGMAWCAAPGCNANSVSEYVMAA